MYSGLLDTDMEIVERYNHSFTVSYMPAGRDATVDYDTNKDFKFTNNTGAPIYIASFVTDNPPDEYGVTLNTLTISVYAQHLKRITVVARVEQISSTGATWSMNQ